MNNLFKKKKNYQKECMLKRTIIKLPERPCLKYRKLMCLIVIHLQPKEFRKSLIKLLLKFQEVGFLTKK